MKVRKKYPKDVGGFGPNAFQKDAKIKKCVNWTTPHLRCSSGIKCKSNHPCTNGNTCTQKMPQIPAEEFMMMMLTTMTTIMDNHDDNNNAAHDDFCKVCQMLSWRTKNWPHFINIRDTFTNVVPLHSVYQAPSYEPTLTFLAPFPRVCLFEYVIYSWRASAEHLKNK